MNRMVGIMFLMIAFVGSANGTTGSAFAEQHVDLFLIIDTSPSTRDVAGELRAVAMAGVKALEPGDRLRILSAHSDRPRVRVIETIGEDRSRYPEIRRALEEIRPAAVLKSDLAAALEVPLETLQESPANASTVVILILTDAKIDDDRAERVLARVKDIKALGAHVICLGLATSNRALLVAAAQGRLNWAKLAEADPAKWLADARRPAPSPTAPAPPQATARESPATKKATPPPPPAAQEPAAAAKPAPSAAPEPARVPAPAAPAQESQPTLPPSSHTTNIPTLPAGPPYRPTAPASVGSPSASVPETSPPRIAAGAADRATPPAPKSAPDQEAPLLPLPSPVGTSPTSPTPDTALGESQTPDVPVKPPSLQQGTEALRSGAASLRPEPRRAPPPADPGAPDAKADISKDGSLPQPLPPPPNLPPSASPATAPGSKTVPGSQTSKTPPPAPTVPAVPADTTNTQRGAARRSSSLFIYVVVAGALGLGAVLAVAAAVVRRQARLALNQRTRSPDGKTKPDRRELYAGVNGQEIALGPLAEIRRLDIGTSPRAAIAVSSDGLLPHHVLLRRDGEVFRLRNLSRKSLTANGVTVKPRGRVRLALPADIILNEKVKVALYSRLPLEEEAQATVEGGGQ